MFPSSISTAVKLSPFSGRLSGRSSVSVVPAANACAPDPMHRQSAKRSARTLFSFIKTLLSHRYLYKIYYTFCAKVCQIILCAKAERFYVSERKDFASPKGIISPSDVTAKALRSAILPAVLSIENLNLSVEPADKPETSFCWSSTNCPSAV